MKAADRALLAALGHLDHEPEWTEEDEAAVDFDGGARDTPPIETDPHDDHNTFLVELIRRSNYGGGEL